MESSRADGYYGRQRTLNNDAVEVADEQTEWDIEVPNPSYLLPRYHQTPRQMRLGFGVSF